MGGFGICGFQNLVSQAGQHAVCSFTNLGIVFDQKDGFGNVRQPLLRAAATSCGSSIERGKCILIVEPSHGVLSTVT